MGFEDIEKHLKQIFRKAKYIQNHAQKRSIHAKTMEAFANKNNKQSFVWTNILSFKMSSLAFVAVAFFVLFNIFPGEQSQLSAGKILPKYGPVEIVRANNVILVQEAMQLQKGDIIKVGNKAEAIILFPDQLTSTAKSKTHLRIVDRDSIFLEKGNLISEAFQEGEISTSRGFVRGAPGASFFISVSDSGETQVISEKEKISVFDWKDGETTLNEGEELRLRTDTELVNKEIPNDLNLSFAQIKAIQAKLIITRTKILTGLEKILDKKEGAADKDFLSAQNSFRSIVQVLETSRDLGISKRKNLDMIKLSDVARDLKEKTKDDHLVTEAMSLETLFNLISQNKDRLGFLAEATGVKSYDRFVLLDRIFRLGNKEERALANILKQKYVVSFLRKIMNEELKIDQVSVLNREISKLPQSETAKDFLSQAEILFSPDLAEMLNEKIKRFFPETI